MTNSINNNTSSPQIATTSSARVAAAGKPPLAEAAAPGKLTKAEIKAKCLEIIRDKGNVNFTDLSNEVWDFLSEHHPEIAAKIAEFNRNHPEAIQLMQDKSNTWKALKAKHGDGMTTGLSKDGKPIKPDGMTLEQFRAEAMKFQQELSDMAAEAMGISSCKGGAFGTPGYNSDVDITLTPKGSTSEEDQMIFKSLMDTSLTHVLEGFSGTQLDVETYLQSPGITLKTANQIKDPDSKKALSRVEITMSMLDFRARCGTNEAAWTNYRDSLLDKMKKSNDPSLYQAYTEMFDEVEAFHELHTKEIYAIAQGGRKGPVTSEALKQAAMVYKYPRLIALSAQMDDLKSDLEKLRKNPEGLSPKDLQKKCDEIEIQLAMMAGLQYYFFDESLLTQSAYNITCEDEGGQKSARANESNLDLIAKNRLMAYPSGIISYTQRPTSSLASFILGAQENFGKYKTKINHGQEEAHEAEEEAAKNEGARNGVKPKEADKAAAAKSPLRIRQDSIVDASKYGVRTTTGCFMTANALKDGVETYLKKKNEELENIQKELKSKKAECEKMKKEGKPVQDIEAEITQIENAIITIQKDIEAAESSIDTLVANSRDIHHTSSELEKCKRQFVLNNETSVSLIMDALKDSGIKANEADVRKVMSMFEPRSSFDEAELPPKKPEEQFKARFDGADLTPAEKFNVAMSILADLINTSQKEDNAKVQANEKEARGQLKLGVKNEQEIKAKMDGIEKAQKVSEKAPIEEAQKARKNAKKAYEHWDPTQDALLTSGNPTIDNVMKARSGFSRMTDKDVQALHDKSQDITMSRLGLTDKNKIDAYVNRIDDVSHDILIWGTKFGLVPRPATLESDGSNAQQFSLQTIWKQTKPPARAAASAAASIERR